MNKKYRYVIVIDTEFISSKEGEQPIQVSLIAYQIKGEELIKISDFNVYVMLKKGLHLNRFARKYTGITNEKLQKEGIYPDMAIQQIVNYLLLFNVEETIVVGWAPNNDKLILSHLINEKEPLLNLGAADWYDLARCYCVLNKMDPGQTPAFESAAEKYNLSGYKFHDSMEDAKATAELLKLFIKEKGIDKILYDKTCKLSSKKKTRNTKETKTL